METGIWPAEQRISYSSLMLYHNIINSKTDRMARQIIEEQRELNHLTMFYGKKRTIANNLKIKLEEAEGMRKAEWKRKVKERNQESSSTIFPDDTL